MAAQRRLRLIPGPRPLLLLFGVAVAVVFVSALVNLMVTRQQLQARYDRAEARVERLQEQNVLLQQNLDREQADQHLPDRAWQYFGKAPRGAGVIVVEPEPAVQPAADSANTAAKPFWVDLWERLTRP